MRPLAFILILASIVLTVSCGGDDKDGGQRTETVGPQPTLSGTPSPTFSLPDATPEADLITPVGPEAVFAVPDELVQPLQGCSFAAFECVRDIMEDAGASEAAINFFAATGSFLTEFRDEGVVDLGVTLNVWRANSNTDWIMLNGDPPAVLAANADVPSFPGDASDALQQLRAAVPDILIWPTDAVFESGAMADGGGQSFVFQYSLNDGCHACATGYFQRVYLNFDTEGGYQGPQLIDVCLAAGAAPLEQGPAASACPTPG